MSKSLCFEILDACPNHCLFCSSRSSISLKSMISFEDFSRTIDYFSSKSLLSEVSISGGEPFLHPDLFRMLKYLQEKKIPSVLFTSGVKVRDPLSAEEISFYEQQKQKDLQEILEHEPWNERLMKNIEHYYERFLHPPIFSSVSKEEFCCLKNLGLQKVVFDFPAYLEETDHFLMNRNRVMRQAALDSFCHASFSGLEVEVHFLPMKCNYREIEELMELFSILEHVSIHILKFVPQGRGEENQEILEMNEEEQQEFFELLEKGRKQFSTRVFVSSSFYEDKPHLCTAGLQKIHIKYDGTILPCAAFKELSEEQARSFGIGHYSIYSNMEEYFVPLDGTRAYPLCKKIYEKK